MASDPVANPTSEDEFRAFAKDLTQFFPSHPPLEEGSQAVAYVCNPWASLYGREPFKNERKADTDTGQAYPWLS
jgi:hypothetical protein